MAAPLGEPSGCASVTISSSPSSARSLIARTADHGTPRRRAHGRHRPGLHVDRDHAARDELREPVGIDDEVVGGHDRAPRRRTVDRRRPVLVPGRAVDDHFGNDEVADADRRAHAAGDPHNHHAIKVSETEQALGGTRRERGSDSGPGCDDVGIADPARVHGHSAHLRGLEPERPHDRSQLRVHRREHADPDPIRACHRPSLPEAARTRPWATRGDTVGSGVSRTRTAGRTPELGRVPATRAEIVGAVIGAGFVVAVAVRPETRGLADLALVAGALVAGAAIAHVARGPGRLRVAGGLTALIAAWLLPQRTDVAGAVILAAFFGAGVSLCVGRAPGPDDRPRRGRHRTTAAVVLLAIIGFAAYVGAETPSVHWFGGGITHGPTDAREVALTFDDGPNLTATLPIMRILDAAGAKATFFEVGHAIDKVPWITQDLYRDGQGLGNHSYHHDQWRWLDPRYPELERTQVTFRKAINACPAFYRPPHGDRTPFIAHAVNDHHMRMVLWDDSSGDWAVKSPQTIARRILRGVRPGSIIVLHDGLNGNPLADRTVLVKALPLILAGLRAKDLHPVRLDKLIGGPAFRPC